MIDTLKPYPKYKDSDQPWVGEIPTHWDVRRQRNLVEMRVSNIDKHTLDGEIPVRLCNYVHVYKNELITKRIPFMRATARPAEIERFRLQEGDVLITKDSEEWTDIGVPALVAYAAPDLVCGYHLAILRPRYPTICGAYLLRALQSQGVASQYYVAANGVTRYGLSHDSIKSIVVPVPPPDEQAAIVRFLNHANRRIDRFIRAKKNWVALLNEQKQAVIHRVITRGVDNNSFLVPSGSHWFPELPSGWKVISLRRLIRYAIDGPHFSPKYLDSGIPFLSARNVKVDRWSLNNVKFVSEEDYKEFSRRVVPEVGDVLYTKGGTTGVARAVDLEFPFQVWVHIAVLKLIRKRIDPEYLAFCLNSPRCYEQSQLFTRGATNQDLGLGRMKQIELPIPPTLEEQERIVAELKARLFSLDSGIAHTKREISLIREYRTRLTTDVVTGKLDVREAAAKLTDDVDAASADEQVGLELNQEGGDEEMEAVSEEIDA